MHDKTPPEIQHRRDLQAYQRELLASAQVTTIAVLLMRCDWLLQWGREPELPADPIALQHYITEAQRAIRSCNETRVMVARHCAESLASRQWEDVAHRVRCAEDAESKDRIIAEFVRLLLDTRDYYLTHDTGRSQAEVIQFQRDFDAEEGL